MEFATSARAMAAVPANEGGGTNPQILNYFRLARWLRKNDRTSYYSLRTVNAMHGAAVHLLASEILGFVNHRYRKDCLSLYADRVDRLRHQQREFEATRIYLANRYSEVQPIADEVYKLSLLLSFICTNHRFEILQALEAFVRMPCQGPYRLLSVGYGTGYELKVVRRVLPTWAIEAFDSSQESYEYASDLLKFFGCPRVNLSQELFPLENADGIDACRGLYGKIVLCELLEHLEHPATALKNLHRVLHDDGHIFLTMAVNIAQEDHIYLYATLEQARQQVRDCGYRIVDECVAPLTLLPFSESERLGKFQKGNYVCIAEKDRR